MERISTVRKAPCWVLWGLCTPNADNLVPGRELKDGHLRWKQAYSPNPLRLVVRVVHVFIIPLLMRFDLADLAGCCSFPSPYLSDYPSQIWLTPVTVTVPAGGGLSFVQGVKVALLLRLRLSKRQSRESLKAGTNWSCDLSPGFMQSWSKKQKIICDLGITVDLISWKSFQNACWNLITNTWLEWCVLPANSFKIRGSAIFLQKWSWRMYWLMSSREQLELQQTIVLYAFKRKPA